MLFGSALLSLVVFLAQSISALEFTNIQAGEIFVPGASYPVQLDDSFVGTDKSISIELWDKDADGQDVKVSDLEISPAADGSNISVAIPEDAAASSSAFFRIFFGDQVADSPAIEIKPADPIAVKAFAAKPLAIYPAAVMDNTGSGEPLPIYVPTASEALLNTPVTIHPTPTTKKACCHCKNGKHTCSRSSKTSSVAPTSSATVVPTSSSSSSSVKPSVSSSTSSAATAKASISGIAIALLMALTVLLF